MVILTVKNRKGEKYETANKKIMCNVNCRNNAIYILSEASLSFLGVGVADSIPTWGNIMNSATSLGVITNYWWMWVIPAVLLTIFVLMQLHMVSFHRGFLAEWS